MFIRKMFRATNADLGLLTVGFAEICHVKTQMPDSGTV